MSGGGGGDGKTPTLNVVSMVDVIFNVIVFFIITAKAASDEMVKMVVPKVDAPNMHAMPADVPRLVVSVVANTDESLVSEQGKVLAKEGVDAALRMGSGNARLVRVGAKEFKMPPRGGPMPELTAEITRAKAERLKGKDPKVKLEVLLRADIGLPYGQVRPVMDAISAAGLENINLMAYQKQ